MLRGAVGVTETNAYSGNNGRAAILNDSRGAGVIYSAGNAGNGANPQPNGVILGAGAQIFSPSFAPDTAQHPGAPTPVGSFQRHPARRQGGQSRQGRQFPWPTVSGNVLYYTKGSGSQTASTRSAASTATAPCRIGSDLHGQRQRRPGADPNKLVEITDHPAASSPDAGEAFATVQDARYGQVVRGRRSRRGRPTAVAEPPAQFSGPPEASSPADASGGDSHCARSPVRHRGASPKLRSRCQSRARCASPTRA